MDIEAFPEIENFQKLPRRVIVKGGRSSFNTEAGAELRGIVINNIGHAIRDLRVNVVIFDEKGIPVMSTSTQADPEILPQGGIGSFHFRIKDYAQAITDYYSHSQWRFNEQE